MRTIRRVVVAWRLELDMDIPNTAASTDRLDTGMREQPGLAHRLAAPARASVAAGQAAAVAPGGTGTDRVDTGQRVGDSFVRFVRPLDRDTPRHVADRVGMVDRVGMADRVAARRLARLRDTADRDHRASGCLVIGWKVS